MRGVGDELALALEHRLGLAPGAVEGLEHAGERARQHRDLVLRLGAGELSARVPGPEHHFLINPYGLLFEEITASSLVKVDLGGNQLSES